MRQLPSYFYPHEKEEKANISQDLRSGAVKSDPTRRCHAGELLSTIRSFHVSTQDCSFLTQLPPHGSPPAAMNWYQSDMDCFDTKHQFHSLGFHRQIDYSSSLQGQKGNFHSLCLSLVQEGKTKRDRQEGAMLEL